MRVLLEALGDLEIATEPDAHLGPGFGQGVRDPDASGH